MPRLLRAGALVLISWLFTSCGVHDDQTGSLAQIGTPDILLFNGAGSSLNDVKAFENDSERSTREVFEGEFLAIKSNERGAVA